MELDECRGRIARYNPLLNAIVTLNPDPHGSGRPITIKDTIDVARLPSTAGDPKRANALAASTAPAAARLLGGYGVLLGKTNVPPYAGDWQTNNRLFGRTVNPWDRTRTPGGSTGGGAAAVAARLTELELGSDVGGSTRIPAAFCGVFGHRATENSIPRDGHVPPAVDLWAFGPLARSAEDLRRAMEVLTGRRLAPESRRVADFRVAVLPWEAWLEVDEEIREALERLAGRLPRARTAQPERFQLAAHEDAYARLLAGATARDPIPAPRTEREAWRRRWRELFWDFDVVLTPAAVVNAFPHDDRPFAERDLEVNGKRVPYKRLEVYAGLAAVSGLPATVFPAGSTRGGLPIGLMAMGAEGQDATTIGFAHAVERELGPGFVPPPDFG